MSMFRYSADRPYVAAFLLHSLLDLVVYLTVDSPWLLLAYFGVMVLPRSAICAFNHHHQHLPVFRQNWANRLLEVPYALQTGVASHAWVLHHSVGHHLNYLDQTKDESRWARDDGTRMGEFEYAVITTLTAYPRAWATGAKYPKFRRTLLVMSLLTAAVVVGLVWYRPIPGLVMYVLTPAVSLFGTAWATYAHHSNRSTANHMVGSNNIMQPFYNWLTGNLGYHTAHHYKPGVHWSKLPELHAQIEAHIPREAFLQPSWPWGYFGKSPESAVAGSQVEDVVDTQPADLGLEGLGVTARTPAAG